MNLNGLTKKNKLIYSVVFDLLGMVSYVFPFVDVFWAPISAYLMVKMYDGYVGKIGGIISFVEEAVPGFDFFPSFTLTWLYVYKWKKH